MTFDLYVNMIASLVASIAISEDVLKFIVKKDALFKEFRNVKGHKCYKLPEILLKSFM